MATPRKLGRSPLNDILAEEGRISANRNMRQIPQEAAPSDQDGLPKFNMFGQPWGERNKPETIGENSGIPIDYSTQEVIDAKPPKDNYGRGPGSSTRVRSHKFVPHSPDRTYLIEKAGVATRANTLGTVYVRFQIRVFPII